MKIRIWLTRMWITGATVLPIGCAQMDGGGGDETHFLCKVDDDCRTLGSDYACTRGVCELSGALADADTGAGGREGSGGNSGTDDRVPPPPQAGLEMAYREIPGGFCPQATLAALVVPDSFSGENPGTEPRLTTGVTCAVTQDGDGFVVDLAFTDSGREFRASGTVTPGSNPAVRISNRRDRGPSQPGFLDTVTDSACPVNVIYVAPGAIHATFDCPGLDNPAAMIECAADGGFVFENCQQ